MSSSSPVASREKAIRPGPRHADDKRHSRKDPLDSARQRHDFHRDAIIFPKHYMMLEKDAVALAEANLRDGDDFPFNLAGASVAEANFGHVAQPRRFAPAGIADEVLDVERRSARLARSGVGRILHAAPRAGESLERFHGRKIRREKGKRERSNKLIRPATLRQAQGQVSRTAPLLKKGAADLSPDLCA